MKQRTRITRVELGKSSETYDDVVLEKAVALCLNGAEYATLFCTPENLDELLYGFAWAEGLIPDECWGGSEPLPPLSLDVEAGVANMTLSHAPSAASLTPVRRAVFTGCCGGIGRVLRGRRGLRRGSPAPSDVDTRQEEVDEHVVDNDVAREDVAGQGAAGEDVTGRDVTGRDVTGQDITFDYREVLAATASLMKSNSLFRETGASHAAGLWSAGAFQAVREDVGRHNAVDKIGGFLLLAHREALASDSLLVTTGRISSDLVLKASQFGFSVLASRGGPTSLAIDHARQLDLTLCGFCRGDRMNVYSGTERILVVP